MFAWPTIISVDDDLDDIQLLHEAFAEIPSLARLVTVQSADDFIRYLFPATNAVVSWLQQVPFITPALIMLDLNMPKLNGLELLKLIRQHPQLQRCKVVMLTTSENPLDKNRCTVAGADLYLVKPSSFAELVSLSAMLLQQFLPTALQSAAEVPDAN